MLDALPQLPQPPMAALSMREAEGIGSSNMISFYVPPAFTIGAERLLRMPGAKWLDEHGLMNRIIIILCLALAGLELGRPGARLVTVETSFGKRSVLRSGAFFWWTFILTSLLLWILLANQMNRRIFFLTLLSFESLVILASTIVTQISFIYNLYDVFGDVMDTEWQILEIAYRSLSYPLGATFLMCTFDAWMLRRKIRILINAIFVVIFSWIWLKHRVLDTGPRSFWSEESTCLWLWCGQVKVIFLASVMQIILFLSKALYIYAYGQPFAHIHPEYILKETGPSTGQGSGTISNVTFSCVPMAFSPGPSPTGSAAIPSMSGLEMQLFSENRRLRAEIEELRKLVRTHDVEDKPVQRDEDIDEASDEVLCDI